jgi:hypothetical protein
MKEGDWEIIHVDCKMKTVKTKYLARRINKGFNIESKKKIKSPEFIVLLLTKLAF